MSHSFMMVFLLVSNLLAAACNVFFHMFQLFPTFFHAVPTFWIFLVSICAVIEGLIIRIGFWGVPKTVLVII